MPTPEPLANPVSDSPPENITDLSLTEHLQKNGLIGLPEDLDITLGPIVARHGPLKDEIKKRGLRAEKGIILHGPPGTGKTSFARHLATYLGCGEKNVQLVSSTKLLNCYVGKTEENIRNLFQPSVEAQRKLRDKSPLFIVAFDEIESIAGDRSRLRNPWEVTAVNELLTCLDGFFLQDNLLVIGLTNDITKLDPALLRTGRFGVQIKIDLPNAENRKAILHLYLKTLIDHNYLDHNISLDQLKNMTANYSGADLKGLVEQVNRLSFARFAKAQKENKDPAVCASLGKIHMDDFVRVIQRK